MKKPSSAKKTRSVLWHAPRFAKNENLFLDTTSTILNMEKFLDFWDKVVLFMTALWMVYIPIDIYYIGDKFPIISLGFRDNITMTLVHSILGWIFLIVTLGVDHARNHFRLACSDAKHLPKSKKVQERCLKSLGSQIQQQSDFLSKTNDSIFWMR